MIDRLLPPEVCAVFARGDQPAAVVLPDEAALVDGAVPARLAEFATARQCARQALAALGVPAGAILRGAKREPLWPAGVVGSLTHCTGYRAAAVARAEAVRTIGIDAEPHEAIRDRVVERILRVEERAWVASAPRGIHWDRLIFSAKESVYKAWYPLAQAWLGFEDASLTIDPTARTFRARLMVPPPAGVPPVFDGRYLVEDGLVVTAIAVLR